MKLSNSSEYQKHLFYRASRISVLQLMNAAITKLDTNEAWHDDNITGASDVELNALQDAISTKLVELQKALACLN